MTPPRDPHTRLRNLPVFVGCSDAELDEIDRLADTVTLPAGRVLMRQGQLGQEFAVVLEGTVTVERDGNHIAELGPGAWFGEVALLDTVPRTATITTATDVTLEVLDRRAFNTLLDDQPHLTRSILRFLAHRLAEAEAELQELRSRLNGD